MAPLLLPLFGHHVADAVDLICPGDGAGELAGSPLPRGVEKYRRRLEALPPLLAAAFAVVLRLAQPALSRLLPALLLLPTSFWWCC